MKRIKFNMAWLLILALFAATSCSKDDSTPTITAEDGMYVFGPGTALTTYDIKGLMKSTPNEVGGVERPGLSELYIALKGGTNFGFNLTSVVGGKAKTYGPGASFPEVTTKDAEEPNAWFARGTIEMTTNKFFVPEDGLYHIVYDATLNTAVVARVNWGIIGGATANGWGGSTALTSSAFDLNTMSFEGTDIILTAGDYKFRYSNGWKIFLDAAGTVKVNTNLGGALAALVPGGGNIANTVVGKYTVKVTWTLATGTAIAVTKTGDYTPPAYPAAMFIVGDATAYGWATPGTVANAIMHKAAGGAPTEGIFWKICFIETGKGFKISADNWLDPNLGFTGPTSYDATGVTIADNGGNMSVAASGMYMVVVNLRDNLKKVSVKPAAVYGIGDCFGGFTETVAANKFTINNTAKTLVSPALPAAGNIRMYASHAWIPSWWQAEFRVNGTALEYRNDGGDQAAVAGVAGKVITLKFDDNTGGIAK